jgi:curli biogenesis system outer membrane secretion channel CsgG
VVNRIVIALALSATAFGQQSVPPASQSVEAIDAELAQRLLNAKRVFVESFGEDAVSKALAAMLSDAIRTSRRFIITENRDKADLILKGTAIEKTSQELHAIGSSSVAGASGRRSGIEDSQASTETIDNAKVAVRLLTPDGDVAWSTTQESLGAKYKSAMADVADKVMKELARELERLSRAKTQPK